MRRISVLLGLLLAVCVMAALRDCASAQSRDGPPPSLGGFNRGYGAGVYGAGSYGERGYGLRAYSQWGHAQDYDAPRSSTPVRTVCVRLCDGYYWPISEEADRSHIAGDAATCQASCRSEARLFTLPAGRDDIASMTDGAGRTYAQLEAAFAYRTSLKAGCGCQPMPWSAEARMRHAAYAADEANAASHAAADTASDVGTSEPEPRNIEAAGAAPDAPAIRLPRPLRAQIVGRDIGPARVTRRGVFSSN